MTRSPMILWWDLWLDSWTTVARVTETMIASAAVIDHRLPILSAAARDPLTADHAELYRMVTEKVEAFTLAGLATMRGIQAMQAELQRATGSLATAGARWSSLALGAGGRALQPVHARATANAKRLGTRK